MKVAEFLFHNEKMSGEEFRAVMEGTYQPPEEKPQDGKAGVRFGRQRFRYRETLIVVYRMCVKGVAENAEVALRSVLFFASQRRTILFANCIGFAHTHYVLYMIGTFSSGIVGEGKIWQKNRFTAMRASLP